MTNKFHALSFLLSFLCSCAMTQGSALADFLSEEEANLKTNRSLLAKYEARLLELVDNPSPESQKEEINLLYKIKALKADETNLREALPEGQQAHEFLRDLITKKSVKHPDKTIIAESEDATLKQVESMHEQALIYVAAKQLNKARKLYEEIVILSPEDDEAYILLGHTSLLLGQYEEAESAFHNAIHINMNNVDEITPFYENMILENPVDDVAHANLGYAYLMLGGVAQAKQAFDDALSINANNQKAVEGLEIISRMD